MRKGSLAVLVVAVLGLAGLIVAATTTATTRAFTLGVLSVGPSAPIKAGQTACQKPIAVPPGGAFDSVDFEIGTYQKLGPAIDVDVLATAGASPRRHGVLPAGYPDVGVEQRQVVRVGRVPDGASVAVCFHNRGPGPVALFGNDDAATQPSTSSIDGTATGRDFDLVFRREARSFATLLPSIARRASLFRPPWVAPGVFYTLLLLLLIGVPVLLARAARSLDRPDSGPVQ